MAPKDRLENGRLAFERRQWREAYGELTTAGREYALPPDDLERAAFAAYLVGEEGEANALWRRAHHEWIDRGEPEAAARCGFWLSLALLLAGEPAQSAGWLARMQRLLQDRPECVEQGFARILEGLHQLGTGAVSAAGLRFHEAVVLATRFEEPDLLAIGLLSQGQACIELGETSRGVRLLDEAMASVTGADVSAIVAGIVYCAVILTCQGIADLRRSCEWTLALDRWCGEQPELVAFRGACLVHRSELFQLRGQWENALIEARRGLEWAVARRRPSGRAWYRCGELHRLRGEFELAEEMYREASRAGTEPQPGLSLLRMAQGRLDVATAAIRRVVDEAGNRHGPAGGFSHAMVSAAYVEIMLAAGELADARAGASKLAALATGDSVVLRAMSDEATGSVRLADGDARGALAVLREAWAAWTELDAPYESARVRVLIARACQALGDVDTALAHFEGAASTFEQLGASVDRERIERHRASARPAASPLTSREVEVLSLLADGKTNREIGTDLSISEHTVARHVSNIFNKIGVKSRTAAAAYAFARGLCPGAHGQS